MSSIKQESANTQPAQQTNLLTLDKKTNQHQQTSSNVTATNNQDSKSKQIKKDVKQEVKGQDLEIQNFLETPDDAQLINTQRSSRTVWLVKAPPFLAQEWNKLYQSGQDEVDVGLFTVTQDEKV